MQRSWIRTYPYALILAAVLGACGGTGNDVGVQVVVDTVAGAERVTYSADPAADLGWALADTIAVIGGGLATEAYLFSPPVPDDLAGTGEGGIVLADRIGHRVLEYGPAGEHRATYGREGAGPGEIRLPVGVALGPGDTIWVNDLGNRRVTGFPRAGGEPRTVPFTRADVFPGSQLAVNPGGFVQVVGSVARRLEPGQTVPEPLVRLDRSLQPLDTLWVRQPDRMDMVELDLEGQSIVLGVSQEYRPDFHWQGLSDGHIVVSDSADYVVRIVAGDGSVRRILRREPPARSTTDQDRQAARDRILEGAGFSLSANGNSPGEETQRRMAEARAEAMTFYARIPRIVELRVDLQDRIWVGISEDSADIVQRIDVFDPDGRLLGELRGVPMPAAFTGQGRVIYTRTDELDVPQLLIVRLRTESTAR